MGQSEILPEEQRVSPTEKRLSDQAFALIYKAITECELPPNSIVSEPQLERRFALGRVALRVAMDRLARMQLVRALHRKGYKVAPITLRDVKNMFEVRAMLEPTVARKAAGRIDVALLNELNKSCMQPAEPGNHAMEAEIINANREFHMLIAQACENDRLIAIIERLLRDTERVYYFGLVRDPRFASMQHDHTKLIDALARGDGDAAEQITREHIESGYRIVLDAILNSSNLQDADISRIGPRDFHRPVRSEKGGKSRSGDGTTTTR
jgi:DNA-binding GntR family transcriptional regulator